MITFMNGILAVFTSDLFLHFIALFAFCASGVLLDFIFDYRGK